MFSNLISDKFDAVMIENSLNRHYFTGFNSSYGYVVLSKEKNFFYTDARYFESAKQNIENFEIKLVQPKTIFETIIEDLTQIGAKKIGYEEEIISVKDFSTFKKTFKDFKLVGASENIKQVMIIKTEIEIEKIFTAQKLAEKSFKKACDGIKVGMTEKEVRANIIYECLKNGADDMSFDTIVAFGENSALPHHHSTDRKLEKNDIILIDFGVRLDGYCSDMTRTFTLGDLTLELKELYELVLEAQNYALKHIKAEMTGHEADSLAREYFKANGYGEEFCHSLGHGVGIHIHEDPRVGENSDTVLKEGMVITVEPGVYIKGVGGVRIEDMVVIREGGINNLTEYNKNINN